MTYELTEFLNDKLKLKENLTEEEQIEFYNTINEYLSNRSKIETLEFNLLKFIDLMKYYHFSDLEIILAIKNNPSYIHADKTELALKYLLCAKIDGMAPNENMSYRNYLIIYKGKYFRTSYKLIYARIKWLNYLKEENLVLRNDRISARKIFKITNEEFETSYGISKEELLEKYPFTLESLEEIKSWEGNIELVEEKQNDGKKY